VKFLWRKGNVHNLSRKRLRSLFRKVFLSRDGLEVLRALLNDWSFFDVCKTEQQRALNDYAKVFLNDYLGLNNISVFTEIDVDVDVEEG
jgi:hypothetical protein